MPTFSDLAVVIRNSIQKFTAGWGSFKDDEPIKFIAEPGRFFASAATCVATKIYSCKDKGKEQMLYVDDGVYGTFNNVLYDHATPVPSKVMNGKFDDSEEIPTTVFGPTCDGLDQMCEKSGTSLPRCKVGEWLLWENMGAYTHTASFVFNGYTHIPNRLHCVL